MDMLLASGAMLSKIINSTFGKSTIKGFDETAAEKIYEGFKNHVRLVESDNVLLVYPDDKWSKTSSSIEMAQAFHAYHSGKVNYKVTIEDYSVGSQYNFILMDSTGFILDSIITEPVTEVLMYGEMILPIEITVPFPIAKDMDFKLRIEVYKSGSAGTSLDNLNLRICGDVVVVDEPTVTT